MSEIIYTDQPNNKSYKKIIIISGIVLLVLVVAVVLGAYFFPKKSNTSLVDNNSKKVVTDDELLKILSANSSLSFWKPITVIHSGKESVPKSLEIFILSDAENVLPGKAVFPDGSTGVTVNYTSNTKFFDTYRALTVQQSKGWKRVYGARNDRAGLIDFQSNVYKVRIIIKPAGEKSDISLISIAI